VRLFGFSESTLADELGFVGFFGGVWNMSWAGSREGERMLPAPPRPEKKARYVRKTEGVRPDEGKEAERKQGKTKAYQSG
jgi:hypothetical protein